jgi:hypothetical protein
MRGSTVRGLESPGSRAEGVRSPHGGAEPIAEIVESGRSPLESIVRDGARRMLQAALESEVDAFLEEHAALLDERGRRRVVRNGYLPSREIATGAGILQVSQPRARDTPSTGDERIVFSSKILPPYLRKSRSMEELIPWLYLKGVRGWPTKRTSGCRPPPLAAQDGRTRLTRSRIAATPVADAASDLPRADRNRTESPVLRRRPRPDGQDQPDESNLEGDERKEKSSEPSFPNRPRPACPGHRARRRGSLTGVVQGSSPDASARPHRPPGYLPCAYHAGVNRGLFQAFSRCPHLPCRRRERGEAVPRSRSMCRCVNHLFFAVNRRFSAGTRASCPPRRPR